MKDSNRDRLLINCWLIKVIIFKGHNISSEKVFLTFCLAHRDQPPPLEKFKIYFWIFLIYSFNYLKTKALSSSFKNKIIFEFIDLIGSILDQFQFQTRWFIFCKSWNGNWTVASRFQFWCNHDSVSNNSVSIN